MPGPSHSGSQPVPAATAAGAVVFLIDESRAMDARIAGGTKSKAECVATAVNSLLNQLAGGPAVDVAIVGYRSEAHGCEDIGCRWGGPLAGRQFVPAGQLADSPQAVETRVRKIPAPDGTIREEQVRFPIWYAPTLDGPVPRSAAYQYCRQLLGDWLAAAGATAKPPLVISFLGELGPEEPVRTAAEGLEQMAAPAGPPWLFHAHLGTSARVPATLYPSSDLHLSTPAVRELFGASSSLPPPLAAALEASPVRVNPGARGLIYNAQMVDLVRFLGMVKAYAAYEPVPGAVLAPEKAAALIVLLLDRSVNDPAESKEKSVWTRLQDHANELLAQFAKRASGRIDAAVVAYGADASGQTAVQPGLPAPLAGQPWARDIDLAGAALRTEELTEQVSNGIGGLVSVARKRAIYLELPPAASADPRPAFAAVRELVTDWGRKRSPGAGFAVVVHFTRGQSPAGTLEEAAAALGEGEGAPLVYHVVRTESPHASLAYPADAARINSAELARLWELSSPLLGRETLARQRPAVSEESRGFVVNGKFDVLVESIEVALTGSTTSYHAI